MKVFRHRIEFRSQSQIEFVDITRQVQELIDKSGVREGQMLVYSPHTTMGVAVNQNEPMLLQDFMRMLSKFAPVDEHYSHDLFELRKETLSDGRSNGHSHCKTLALGVSEVIPIERGRLVLSERQSVFAVETDGSRNRDVCVQVMGL